MENYGHEMKSEVAAALERIGQIDLSKIGKKLHYDDPVYWSYERIAEAEIAYRRFLALNLLYPGETLAVNRIIDEYWHNHILDTLKYAQDCDLIFGSFLHHYPYFGSLARRMKERTFPPSLSPKESGRKHLALRL